MKSANETHSHIFKLSHFEIFKSILQLSFTSALRSIHQLLVLFFRTNDQVSKLALTGTCWDQVTNNHVLFQAHELICLSADSSFAQHFRRFLEGGARQPQFHLQWSV